jgi:hypothetical protein
MYSGPVLTLDEIVLNRAEEEYLKRFGPNAQAPSARSSGTSNYKGKWYALLRNCNDVLAVCRILNNSDLQWLDTWPKALEER